MTETQQRFLKAIAERIPGDRIAEVRLFPPMRQGQVESAVAVVAVEGLGDEVTEREVTLEATPADLPMIADLPAPADTNDLDLADVVGEAEPIVVDAPAPATTRLPASRFSIVTARYVLTIKGPDRGKWEFELVHDADAPLETVERVVRGVANRVGDAGEPDLLSPAEFQRAVTEPWYVGNKTAES